MDTLIEIDILPEQTETRVWTISLGASSAGSATLTRTRRVKRWKSVNQSLVDWKLAELNSPAEQTGTAGQHITHTVRPTREGNGIWAVESDKTIETLTIQEYA